VRKRLGEGEAAPARVEVGSEEGQRDVVGAARLGTERGGGLV